MSLLDIFRKKQEANLHLASDKDIRIEAAARSTKSGISDQIKHAPPSQRVQTFNSWKLAVLQAKDPEEPNNYDLLELYNSMKLDGHLMGAIDNRILRVQRSEFELYNDKGEADVEAKELLQRPWFDEFIETAIKSKFEGLKLLEMYELNAEMELDKFTEIPQAHIDGKNHLIKKEIDSKEGWDYTSASLRPYYMPFGNYKDLGLFEYIAPVVLGKKLAIGSWLDFIEKFGVPPRWVTTDREDDTRMAQLFTMMKNMVSNSYAVLRGQEKIEIAQTPNTDSYQVFKEIINMYNDEMSIRVLGGTGNTSEKSHVGSAAVHYENAKDRYESDKLFIKHLYTTQLLPRLLTLSPVYAPLGNLHFDWDDSENLNIKEVVENAVSLSQYFDIDTDYIAEKTGIPILGMKTNPLPSEPSGGTAEKK